MAELKTEEKSEYEREIIESNEHYFTRTLELDSLESPLTFYQREIGDVSCVIWDASLVLAHYLENRAKQNPSAWKDIRAVELGAGVGCVGIVAACLGVDVIMTDLPAVLPLLERNIIENRKVWSTSGGSVQALQLCWGDKSSIQTPNLLLLADCVYYPESVTPLVETMRQLSNETTEILICQEKRESDKQQHCWRQFTAELEKYFKFETVPLSEQHPVFRSPDIIIMKGFLSKESLKCA